MAKNKARSKLIIPVVVAGVFIALFLTTGFPLQFIPIDAQGFLDEINDAPPDSFEIPVNCITVDECDGEFVTQPTPIDELIDDCDITPIPDTNLIIQECNNEVLDPIDNMTKTIGDDGSVTEPEPEPEPELFEISIVSKISKTDNTGETFESTTNFPIPLLAFFVEDTSDKDFDNGFIQQGLIVTAPPDTQINLDANFDVLIANQTVLTEPITISITGFTDENGELTIDYVNPIGLKSKDFLFSFSDHLDKFPITGNEKVEFELNNIKISSGNFEFALESVVIYSIEVATDLNQIIIVDEEGGRTRVFPTDDTLRLYSTTATQYVARNCVPRRICSPAYTWCCYIAPAMGSGQLTHILKDGTEEVVAEFDANSAGGASQKINMKIQRDEIYRIDITSPTKVSITFKTPIEQTTYTFYCKGTSATSTTGLGYCNFQQASFQKTLADTLVTP